MPSAADRRQLTRSLPPLADEDAAGIERFLDAAWAEHGLSRATLSAYRADLQGLARWLRAAGRPPLAVSTLRPATRMPQVDCLRPPMVSAA